MSVEGAPEVGLPPSLSMGSPPLGGGEEVSSDVAPSRFRVLLPVPSSLEAPSQLPPASIFFFCFLISTSALSRPTNREADATSHTGAASNRTHPETVSEAGERLVFLSPPPLSLCACVVYVPLARLSVSVSVSLVSSSRRARGRRCGQPPTMWVGSLSSALSGCRRLAQCEKDGTSPQNRNSSFLG